jgi:AmmeMemoRadiSam system protein B
MAAETAPQTIRPAAVAGLFYPQEPPHLAAAVESLLDATMRRPAPAPKALIVPHAGYAYSGPVAARAYGTVASTARSVRRIVLIGPSHRECYRGLAVPVAQAFATPLGVIPIDRPAIDELRRLDVILASDVPHALEHSLEVQLPFLQHLAPAAIVPLLVGDASPAEVESVLDTLWGEPDTLIVVSSDLSHYHPYDIARTIDAATAQSILQGREDLSAEQACGCIAIDGLARIRRKRRLHAELLDLCNSADTAGDRRRVVGYGAFGFYDA